MAIPGVDIKGIPEMQRALDELVKKVHNRIMRKGIGAAAKVLRDGVRAAIPTKTGKTKKAITWHISHGKLGKVGASASRGFILNFLEAGSKPHIIDQPKMKRKLSHPGFKPLNILQNTAKTLESQAIQAAHQSILSELNRL